MNREQAEKLLAAMIFDDLDEASRAELLARLQTDDELRERLTDLRMAVKLATDAVNEGPAPTLSDNHLKELRQLAKGEKPRTRVFSIRRMLGVAAVLVFGLVIVGSMVTPKFARRSEKARIYSRMATEAQKSLADESEPVQRYMGPSAAEPRVANETGGRTGSGLTAGGTSNGRPADSYWSYEDRSGGGVYRGPVAEPPAAPSRGLSYATPTPQAAGEEVSGLTATGPAARRPMGQPQDAQSTMGDGDVDRVATEVARGGRRGGGGYGGRGGSYGGRMGGMAGGYGMGGMGGMGGMMGGMGANGLSTPMYAEGVKGNTLGVDGRESQIVIGRPTVTGGSVNGPVTTTDGMAVATAPTSTPAPTQPPEPSRRVEIIRGQEVMDGIGQAGRGRGGSAQASGPAPLTFRAGREQAARDVISGAPEGEGLKAKLPAPTTAQPEGGVSYYSLDAITPSKPTDALEAGQSVRTDGSSTLSGDGAHFSLNARENAAEAKPNVTLDARIKQMQEVAGMDMDSARKPATPMSAADTEILRRLAEQRRQQLGQEQRQADAASATPFKAELGAVSDEKRRWAESDAGHPVELSKEGMLGDKPLVDAWFKQELDKAKKEDSSGQLHSKVSGALPVQSVPVAEAAEVPAVQIQDAATALDLNAVKDLESLSEPSHFRAVPVNPWVMTERDALSTFGLDVDTASYAVCRQYIRSGSLPPVGAVRMEEFINAFDYAYPQRNDATFAVYAEGAPSPFAPVGQDVTLLKIAVKARTVGRDQRRAAHIVFVVDASASMGQPDRLPLVQSAMSLLVDKLSDVDRVSLITCAGDARLHLEAVPAQQRDVIRQTVESIQPAGPTNLMAGLELGYAIARRAFVAGQINQVVLCSDGVANVGQTEAQAVLEKVAEDRKQGITLTCVGVGHGAYNDVFLEALANRGDGRYVFLDASEGAQESLVGQLAATLQTVAKDARIQVQFDPARVRRYRLIGYENRDIEDQRFRDDTIDAGEVGSGQCSTALYELELTAPVAAEGGNDLGTVFVRYRNAETEQIEEFSRVLAGSLVRRRSVEEDPRFFLAAGAARFAEWLRESEHARHTTLAEVQRVLDEVAVALPLDASVEDLAMLVHQAEGLPRAAQP